MSRLGKILLLAFLIIVPGLFIFAIAAWLANRLSRAAIRKLRSGETESRHPVKVKVVGSNPTSAANFDEEE